MSQTATSSNLTDAKRAMAARLLAAVELMDFSVALMRQNITRKLPGATSEEITSELRRWLIEQPPHFEVKGSTVPEAR